MPIVGVPIANSPQRWGNRLRHTVGALKQGMCHKGRGTVPIGTSEFRHRFRNQFKSLPPPTPLCGRGVCIWMHLHLVNGTGNSLSPGRPAPGVVKQDKSSVGSVDTTKTR